MPPRFWLTALGCRPCPTEPTLALSLDTTSALLACRSSSSSSSSSSWGKHYRAAISGSYRGSSSQSLISSSMPSSVYHHQYIIKGIIRLKQTLLFGFLKSKFEFWSGKIFRVAIIDFSCVRFEIFIIVAREMFQHCQRGYF